MWLDVLSKARAEQERWRVMYEEENVVVGPMLPESATGGMGRADYGGALLPGEGDRWVAEEEKPPPSFLPVMQMVQGFESSPCDLFPFGRALQ